MKRSPMDAETEKALRDSIAHWKRMRDEPNCKEKPHADHCALCVRFAASGSCQACPVCEAGGGCLCNASPYPNAKIAWNYRNTNPDAWHKAATAEIDFLTSLLPKEKDMDEQQVKDIADGRIGLALIRLGADSIMSQGMTDALGREADRLTSPPAPKAKFQVADLVVEDKWGDEAVCVIGFEDGQIRVKTYTSVDVGLRCPEGYRLATPEEVGKYWEKKAKYLATTAAPKAEPAKAEPFEVGDWLIDEDAVLYRVVPGNRPYTMFGGMDFTRAGVAGEIRAATAAEIGRVAKTYNDECVGDHLIKASKEAAQCSQSQQ